ncbi:MAG: RHS repeat-associated core domain-containing protein, partial [Nocardiopsaceae bacterium]|nr:RHS repeat-associated core domain-containing protein [Nocardiopsaceae bacterium]
AGTPAELVAADGTLAGYQQRTLWGTTAWLTPATPATPGTGAPAAPGTSPAATPLRFPGQYHDPETGLHYNNQRYYDPETGAYLTPDPLGLAPAPNPHAYVPNPHTAIDPLGLLKCGPHVALGRTGEQLKDADGNPIKLDGGNTKFELHAFAEQHGAITYFDDMFKHLTDQGLPPNEFTPQFFDLIMKNGGSFSFNLKDVDVEAALNGTDTGYTAEEVRYIASHPEVRAVTKFYNGKPPF